jgi:hypothetical protein
MVPVVRVELVAVPAGAGRLAGPRISTPEPDPDARKVPQRRSSLRAASTSRKKGDRFIFLVHAALAVGALELIGDVISAWPKTPGAGENR